MDQFLGPAANYATPYIDTAIAAFPYFAAIVASMVAIQLAAALLAKAFEAAYKALFDK